MEEFEDNLQQARRDISDSEYVTNGINLWINNKPKEAMEHLEERKNEIVIAHGLVLLNFINAVISFDSDKFEEVQAMMKELEKKCASNVGWLKSIRSKLFGMNSMDRELEKTLEEQIIVADTQILSAILTFLAHDVSGVIKAGIQLRRAWKNYDNSYREIYELNRKSMTMSDAPLQGFKREPILHRLKSSEFDWTPPSSVPQTPGDSTAMVKSKSSFVINNTIPPHMPSTSAFNLAYSSASWLKKSFTTNFRQPPIAQLVDPQSTSNLDLNRRLYDLNANDYEVSIDKEALKKLVGAVNFGYGILQLCLSLLPPNILKLISFLGFMGDRETGLRCLKICSASKDSRSPLAILSLLWYFTVIAPFFAFEDSNLTNELNEAIDIMNEFNDLYGKSSFFLFFRGRIERLKSCMENAIKAYKYSNRVATQREIKLLCLHELGWCYMIELELENAGKYFKNLRKSSKFSRSFYSYLTAICGAGDEGCTYDLFLLKEEILLLINKSPQKDGQIEKFVLKRCSLLMPGDEECLKSVNKIYWKLLVYEMLFFWNALSSCSSTSLQAIIDDCKFVNSVNSVNSDSSYDEDEATNNRASVALSLKEPIQGLSCLIEGACHVLLKDPEKATVAYRKCVEGPEDELQHVQAFAHYELAILLKKESPVEAKLLLQAVQTKFHSFDFEQRLSLRVARILTPNVNKTNHSL